MSQKVYIFLADGFEDVEALAVVDLMRRAGLDIQTVSIKEETEILTSHGIRMFADTVFADVDFSDAELLILPGGKVGTSNLKACEPLSRLLLEHCSQGKKIAAICAAPTILSDLGLLADRRATSYPTCEPSMKTAQYLTDRVVVDGNITTSRGMGTALDFGLNLIGQLLGEEKEKQIADAIVY